MDEELDEVFREKATRFWIHRARRAFGSLPKQGETVCIIERSGRRALVTRKNLLIFSVEVAVPDMSVEGYTKGDT